MSDPAPASGAPATSDALGGSSWLIATIDGESVMATDAVSVAFGHDGRLTGTTGLNHFTASYAVSAGYLTIGPMATTRRAGDPAQMAQEHRVVAALAGMCSFELREPHLAIDGPMGWVELEAVVLPPARAQRSATAGGPEGSVSPSG